MFNLDMTSYISSFMANQQQQAQMTMFENSIFGQQMAATSAKTLAEGATIFDDRIERARAKLDSLLDDLESASTAARQQRIQQSIDDVRGDIKSWTRARDRILVSRA